MEIPDKEDENTYKERTFEAKNVVNQERKYFKTLNKKIFQRK